MSFAAGLLVLGACVIGFVLFLGRVLRDLWDDDAGKPPTVTAFAPVTAWVALGVLAKSSLDVSASIWPLAVIGGLLLVVLAVPTLWVRLVAIPLGRPRSAYLLTRLSVLAARTDPVGLAMLHAGRAACRQRKVRLEDLAWVRGRVKQRPLTPGMIMGLGLVAAAQGDRDEARQFIASLSLFDQGVTDATVERLAQEWLAADAAQRGAWSDVADIADRLGPTTHATRWLGAVAKRLLGRPDAPTDERLEELWRRVPGRDRTEWIQRRARAAEPVVVDDAPLPDDVVDAALHAQLRLDAHPSRAALAQAAACWEAALPGLAATAVARAEALGSHQPEQATERLHAQVADALTRASRALGTPVPTVGGLSGRAAGSVRDDHLRTVELAASAMEQRLAAHKALPPVDELREWLALKHVLDQAIALGGDDLLRVAFRPVYGPCCTLSVRLYNQDAQPWVSNAMTRWLLKLAHRAGDERAVALQTKNLSAVSG